MTKEIILKLNFREIYICIYNTYISNMCIWKLNHAFIDIKIKLYTNKIKLYAYKLNFREIFIYNRYIHS